MSKRKMIADAKIRQDGEWIKPGHPFECTEGDADDLIAMGMAHPDPNAAASARPTYRRRDMTAQ